MVRVTFIDGQKYRYVYYDCEIDELELVTDYGQKEYIPYENIIKIEKQVKNLTLEECYKLGVNIDTYINYYELNGQVLDFDDYIDITHLIKEE